MAGEPTDTNRKGEPERPRHRSRRMYEADMTHNLIASREESKTEGRSEVARNLKNARTMSNEEIAKHTGLSLSDVEKL
jgi:hypothetical protein